LEQRVSFRKKRQIDPSANECAVLITGAGSGIGKATALSLNEQGYQVFAGLRRIDQGEELRSLAADAEFLVPLPLDVTDSDAVDDAARIVSNSISGNARKLIGLVNNAADENLGPVEVLPMEIFRREMDVGYFGAVAVTKAFLPLLRSTSGRIVNMSSINGLCTFKYHATTCATKYALEAFSDALRMEVKPWGMHVAVVEPGPTDTPLMKEKTIEEFAVKLAAYPEDVRGQYFQDFDATIESVKQFVDQISIPPKNRLEKLRRLFNGQGWLHSPMEVVSAIEHALFSNRPKTRYLVGTQAKLIYRARRLLSDRRFDSFLGENVFDF
jgi:NAD(P)-dependent dehydrogenase (short-subunit alcohol dehydrogenase family)